MGLPIGLFFPLSCMSESGSQGLPNQECGVPVPSDLQIKYIHDLRFTRPRQPASRDTAESYRENGAPSRQNSIHIQQPWKPVH